MVHNNSAQNNATQTTSEKQFVINEMKEQISQIKKMIQDLTFKSEDLKKQIDNEEKRTHVSDQNHFSYSPLAKAARQRRVNISQSIDGLNAFLKEKQHNLIKEKEKINENLKIINRVQEMQSKK